MVGKQDVIRLLPVCPSTGSNRDHFLQADFTGLIPPRKSDSFRLADDPEDIVWRLDSSCKVWAKRASMLSLAANLK